MWSDLSSDMKNVHNVASHVSKNVPVLLNGTVHTQTHVSAHLDTQCDVIARSKYRRCWGHAETLSPHMCPSAFTPGHMSIDKSLNMSSDLRPSVKALQEYDLIVMSSAAR